MQTSNTTASMDIDAVQPSQSASATPLLSTNPPGFKRVIRGWVWVQKNISRFKDCVKTLFFV